MTQLKYFQAVSHSLATEMRRDPTVVLLGEDVAKPEGIFAQYRGLLKEFGPDRVYDTAVAETGFTGAAIGMALTGLRPVIEISFADFFAVCLDQLVNQAAKIHYMSGGQCKVPMTVVAFGGGGLGAGPQHSGMYDAVLSAVPGLKVTAAATASDVVGLLATAVRDDDPTIVLLHKGLLQKRSEIPDDASPIPYGTAQTLRTGKDVTLVAWSAAVHTCLAAAELLADRGVEADVIDLRSLQPWDVAAVHASVARTHRLICVEETTGFASLTAEIAATIGTLAFDELDAPIERVHAPFSPVPYAPNLEKLHAPDAARVEAAALRSMGLVR